MTNPEHQTKTILNRPTPASVSGRLEKLKGDKRRSQTALLAENLASIEKALSEGIPRVAVWEALCEEGFTLTFKSFETFLHRLRKRMAAPPSKTPPQTSSTPTQAQARPIQASPTPGPPQGSAQEGDDPHYKAFRESIKHLSPREQQKREGVYWTTRPR